MLTKLKWDKLRSKRACGFELGRMAAPIEGSVYGFDFKTGPSFIHWRLFVGDTEYFLARAPDVSLGKFKKPRFVPAWKRFLFGRALLIQILPATVAHFHFEAITSGPYSACVMNFWKVTVQAFYYPRSSNWRLFAHSTGKHYRFYGDSVSDSAREDFCSQCGEQTKRPPEPRVAICARCAAVA